jgi:hypothetical protein
VLFSDEQFEDEDYESSSSDIGNIQPKLKKLALALLALMVVGTTFATNVNLGSNRIEFGQGVRITSACDDSITAKPISEFKNNGFQPGMYVKAFRLTGISQNCQDKLFVLRAYPDTGSALSMNSAQPNFSLKFHFTNLSWMQDMNGCLFFNNVVIGSSDNNSVDLDFSGCYANYNPPTNGSVDNPPLKAQALYKFTLETRPNTVAKIDLSTDYGANGLGWVFSTGDEVAISVASLSTNYSIYPDLAYGGRFNVYGRISDIDFASGSAGPSIYIITPSPGISCTYSGKVAAGAPISSGIFANYQSPGAFKAVVYECTATTSGSVALNYALYSA